METPTDKKHFMFMSIEIGKKIVACAILSLVISCAERKQLKVENENNINFRFYFRNFGCNNGYCTYSDELVIENYVDNTLTSNDLSKIALSYTDTAKADLPISRITFFGELNGNKLPIPIGKNLHEYANYYIVSFTFNNSISVKTSGEKLFITKVSMKKGDNTVILDGNLDSILTSKKPIKFNN